MDVLAFTLIENESTETLIYLPHPFYDDEQFLSELSEDQSLKIGKWVKKDFGGSVAAVFGFQIVLFVLRPAWDDYYKSTLGPKIKHFKNEHFERLKSKGINLEHVQFIKFSDEQIELRFVPAIGVEKWCFSENSLTKGIKLATQWIEFG